MNTEAKLMKAIKEFGLAKSNAANTTYHLETRAIAEDFAEDKLKQLLNLSKQWLAQ